VSNKSNISQQEPKYQKEQTPTENTRNDYTFILKNIVQRKPRIQKIGYAAGYYNDLSHQILMNQMKVPLLT
jgi:hypothetical protein